MQLVGKADDVSGSYLSFLLFEVISKTADAIGMSAMRTALRETDERTTVTNKLNPQKVFLYATDFL